MGITARVPTLRLISVAGGITRSLDTTVWWLGTAEDVAAVHT
jgi:hypothetical protein